MSAIQIPGLDIEERSPGSFRARSRVHPFFALTDTFDSELSALSWGCQQLVRLHALHKKLSDEARLPKTSLTRESAKALGLEALIEGEGSPGAAAPAKASSAGDEIYTFDVLDSLPLEAPSKSMASRDRERCLNLRTSDRKKSQPWTL